MSRTPRLVVAAATLAGCLLIGVVVGAVAASGGEDAAGPVANRTAASMATTSTALATASSSTVGSTAATTVPPTTAPPTTAPPTTAPPTTAAAGPVADFGWSPEQPRPGESIRLLDRSSGGPVSYTWRWSGSTIRSSKAGNIAFSLQQDTDVTLEVCDRDGRCNQATKTIVVG